jgi:Mg2+-importing ATPase
MGWLFGLAVLLGLSAFAAQAEQQVRFAELLARAQPVWLVIGIALQLGTYPAEAALWRAALRRAGRDVSLRDCMALNMAKLFLDQTVPTGGLSGTLLVVRGLDRRAVPRAASMAAVVASLVSHYIGYGLGVVIALAVVWLRADLTPYLLVPAAAFGALAAVLPTLLLRASSGSRRLPAWVARVPLVRSALSAVTEADPEVAHDVGLIARCTLLQLVIVALDALTLWAMLLALGLDVDPAPVFASFMLSTLARILGVVPGGLGIFEAVSVASLRLMGVPIAAGLAATMLFRGFSFWLPLLPAALFAQREALSDAAPPRSAGAVPSPVSSPPPATDPTRP